MSDISSARLAPQSYGIAMGQRRFGGPRGIWLECGANGCTTSSVIVGSRFSGDPFAYLTDAEAAQVFRNFGWTGEGESMKSARCPDCSRKEAAQVVGYRWEVTAEHPRLIGKAYDGGGDRLALGDRGPFFPVDQMEPGRQPWGLRQIWIMRNGQEVRATWKRKP